MNKKVYSKPAMREVQLRMQCHLLAGSVQSNAGVGGGTSGSSGTGRSRQFQNWDDDNE